MPLSTGSHLGPYEILGLLGAGGMGEVYRARDTRLHRDVALKILPETATGDASAEARFEREARAIASVNHPNICAIHDVGIDGGRRFLVMELLEGETLQARLLHGPFDVPDLLDHAAALADAVQTAHARGVIHRDLKPANIFLTSRGQLKILDFGLARASEPLDGSTRAADDLITARGAAVGTAAYMSPEQIRGEGLDSRTDLFSLSLVLFEMATGQRAFVGTTGAAVAASILNHEAPRPGDLRSGLPAGLDEAILKGLERDRDLRYQSAADLRADIKRMKRQLSADGAHSAAGATAGAATVARSASNPRSATDSSSSSDTQLLAAIISRHRVWVAVAVAVIAIAAAAAVWLRRDARASGVVTDVLADVQVTPLTFDGDAVLGAISPDGRFVVYLKEQRGIRVRQISGERDVELVAPGWFSRISSLSVTPDGNFVDVVAIRGAGPVPDVWRVPLLGGNPQQILRNAVSAIGWSPDGRMAFVRLGAAGEMTVVIADANGANQRELVTRTTPKLFYGETTTNAGRPPMRPAWSPDGALLLLPGYSADRFGNASELVVVDAQTGAERPSAALKGVWTEAAWLTPKRLLLVGGEGAPELWAYDLASHLLSRITREFGSFGSMSLTADRTTAVAKRFTRSSGIWVSAASGADSEEKVALSPAGAARPLLDATGGLTYTAFKSDGVSAVYYLAPGAATAVQIVERATYPAGPLFHDLSADGRTIVYADLDAAHRLYHIKNDGSERGALVDGDARLPRFTPDGATVLFAREVPGLYSVPAGGGAVRQLTDRVVGRDISVSPDGTQVLFSSAKPEIVTLCDLPGCTDPRDLPLRSVSWAPDGAGVTYLQNQTTIMEQPLDGGPPRALVRLPEGEPILNWRWSPDGTRLAVSRGKYPNDLVLIKGLR